MVRLFGLLFLVLQIALIGEETLPMVFGYSALPLCYFHAPDVSIRTLNKAACRPCLFAIDLAFAHTSNNPYVKKDSPYIGQSEEFYTEMHHSFPKDNVDLEFFLSFLEENYFMKVLIHVKDAAVYPILEEFIQKVGPERCMVYAFIKEWNVLPEGAMIEPHWHREDVELSTLDALLIKYEVPLIANCRAFNDMHVEKNQLIEKMVADAKRYKSVVSLGLYYKDASLPSSSYLKRFNDAGLYAWVNGNIPCLKEKMGNIRYIAVCDHLNDCTAF